MEEAARAAVLVYDEPDCWVLQKLKDLGPRGVDLQGKRVRVFRLGKYQVGDVVEAKGSKVALDFNLEPWEEGEKKRKYVKMNLNAEHRMGVLDDEFAEHWQREHMKQWLAAHEAKKAEGKKKRKHNFERRYRDRVEQTAHKTASLNEAAWMPAGNIMPKQLVNQMVNVVGKGKGRCIDYQDLVDLHTVKFEDNIDGINGTVTLSLSDGSVEFQIMSE